MSFLTYRSLSLWSQLHNCTVTQDEFVSASCSTHEICDFHLLKDGEIGIHNEKAIIYYDVNTLKQTNRPVLSGHYYRYFENNDVILVLGTTSHLYVIRKVLRTPLQADTIFPSVKTFLVNENVVYFATRENKIHICNLLQDEIKSCVLGQIPDHVECFGYKNDLHILTYKRNIYTIIGTEIIFQRNIDDTPNLLHMLNQYNFLENLDFGMYYHWMFILEHHIPRDSLRKIFVVKVYGDMVFVGSNSGDLKIYHSPYLNNELDLFNTEPVKQYNLGSYNNDRPGLSSRPIIKIDVIEREDSHTVIVGMPHKIVVLNFNHYFESNFNKCLQSIEY